ncbi:MAG: MlaD family protein [Gammaproteobacteria bacterium]
MTEYDSDNAPLARTRRHRWFAWVWAVPIVAGAIVLWLGARSFVTHGPDVTISFRIAEGLQERQSTIRHRGVIVGRVEELELAPDLSRVIVHARMTRSAKQALNENTQFYIVSPHVGVEGITGLSTIVSGVYIEMEPAIGSKSQDAFVGLEEPPLLRPDTPGRAFTVSAPDLGSLTRGSPVSYHGVSVGEVEGYSLMPDGRSVSVTAFIRAPYDRLVHPETRFWNAGGVDVSVGAQGVRIRASSWQQLLGGGIAFETPPAALNGTPSPQSASFTLFDTEAAAMREPRGEQLVYVAGFSGNLRAIDAGTAVELEGMAVGTVRDVKLSYEPGKHALTTLVTIAIDPDRVRILNMPAANGATSLEGAQQKIETLVAGGLRAQLLTANFLTGIQIVTLDMTSGAPPARIERVDGYVKIPTTASSDIGETLRSLRNVLQNIDRATSGPQLGHAIQSLDSALTHLDQLATDVQPDLASLLKSLRETSDSTNATLTSLRNVVDGQGGAAGAPDVSQLMRELSEAARSVRGLADYLERHPESLIRGRRGEK